MHKSKVCVFDKIYKNYCDSIKFLVNLKLNWCDIHKKFDRSKSVSKWCGSPGAVIACLFFLPYYVNIISVTFILQKVQCGVHGRFSYITDIRSAVQCNECNFHHRRNR